MFRWPLLLSAIHFIAALAPAGPLLGAEPLHATGVLRAVDPDGRSVILRKTTGELLELKVGNTATITLDGRTSALDALKPGRNVVVEYDVRDGSIRSLKSETEPVRLSISTSREGECRINLGRGIATDPPKVEGDLVPITRWYSARPTEDPGVGTGSLTVVPSDPKRRGGMAISPRSFRLPCSLVLEAAELGDARLGVQWITSTVNFVVSLTSNDEFREGAKLSVVCSSKPSPESGSYTRDPVNIEQAVRLAEPRELHFYVPFHPDELKALFTVDAVLGLPKEAKSKGQPTIRNLTLKARNDRSLGLVLVAKQGKVVVESVDPGGLASAAGVRIGDVMVSLNEQKIPQEVTASTLPGLLFSLGTAAESKLTILRAGKQQVVTIPFDELVTR